MRALLIVLGLVALILVAATAGGSVYILDSRLDARTINTAVLLCAGTPALVVLVVGVAALLVWREQRRQEMKRSGVDPTAAMQMLREMMDLWAAHAKAQALDAQAQRAQQTLLAQPTGDAGGVRWEVPAEWLKEEHNARP